MTTEEQKLSLVQHLTALRGCLIRGSLALIATSLVSLYFSKQIFEFLQQPLIRHFHAGSSFIATSPLEAVVTYLKVGLLSGLFLSSPFLLYQVWLFIAPGLYAKERRYAMTFVGSSTLLFVGGAAFGYYVIFPFGFDFFVSLLTGTQIQFLPRMEDYLGFVTKMLLTFGGIFELPLILVALAVMGVVHHKQLASWRRYVLVLTFLVGGILTPGPDVMSQFLMSVPLLILYEVSLLIIRFIEKKN